MLISMFRKYSSIVQHAKDDTTVIMMTEYVAVMIESGNVDATNHNYYKCT